MSLQSSAAPSNLGKVTRFEPRPPITHDDEPHVDRAPAWQMRLVWGAAVALGVAFWSAIGAWLL